MSGPVIVLTLAGFASYVYLMSALGRWLGSSRKRSSVAYLPAVRAGRASRFTTTENRERIAG